jgi:hypothetical protein
LAKVIPIIVRPVNWRTAQFAELQALPQDGRPVTAWGEGVYGRDTAWTNVAAGIERVLKELATDRRS